MAMMLLRWLILTVAIMAASYTLSGIYVRDFLSAFWAAAILGILNTIFRPLLLVLTLPINILSLGLFTFVINAFLLMLASGVIEGFDVSGFGTAIIGSLMISLASWFLSSFIGRPGGPAGRGGNSDDYIEMKRKDDGRWE